MRTTGDTQTLRDRMSSLRKINLSEMDSVIDSVQQPEPDQKKINFTPMQQRNMDATNALMKLGNGKTEVLKGKAHITGTRATAKAEKQEYFPYESFQKVPAPHNKDVFQPHATDAVKQSNDLTEHTLKKEALAFFKAQPKVDDKMGSVFETIVTK